MPTPVRTLLWAANSIGGGVNTETGSNSFTLSGGETLVASFVGISGADLGAPTDTAGTFTKQAAAYNAFVDSATTYGGWYTQYNASAGSHTISMPSVGGGQDGIFRVYKVTNLGTSPTIRTTAKLLQNNANKTITLTTIGAVVSGDIAFGVRTHENNVGSTDTITQPSGWTSDVQYLDGNLNIPTDNSTLLLTSGGSSLSATWTSVDNAIANTSAAIIVFAPLGTNIVVTTPPVSANVTQGGFATFSVSISGATGTEHYQWAVDGVSVGTDSSTLVYQPSVSKTSSVTVTITDDLGSITTAPVTMRVFRVPAPAKVRKYRPIYGADGSGLSLFANSSLASAIIDPSQISLATSGGGSGINASLNVTEGADTVSSTTAVLVTVTDSSTEGSDTSSATTGVLVTTTLSATEGSDSVSAGSAVLVKTTASITEAGDTVSASTTSLIAASASITEASDTLSATAAVLVTSSNSDTEGSDTVSASTAVAVVATLSATEGADTLSSLTGAGAINASLTVTEGSDSVSSTVAVLVTSTSSVTEAPDSLASTTGVLVQTSAVMTEGSDSVSATVSSVIGVSLSATEGSDTLTANSAVGVTASLTVTEGADTLSATAGAPAAVVNLDVTEGSDSVSSVVTALVTGSVNATEGADTTSGATSVLVSASASITEAPDGLAAGVAVGVVVNASITEAPDTLNSTVGSPAINASVNVTEDADSVAFSGIVIVGVSTSVVESPDTGISFASVAVTANVAVVESRDTSFGNSGVVVTASLNVVEHSDSISSFIQTVVEEGLIYIDPGLQPYTNGDLVYYTSRSQIGT